MTDFLTCSKYPSHDREEAEHLEQNLVLEYSSLTFPLPYGQAEWHLLKELNRQNIILCSFDAKFTCAI